MIIGIISDTHDYLVGLRKAIKIFKQHKIELLIHCGDWVSPFTLEFFDRELGEWDIPVKSVIGNNPGDLKRTLLANAKMKHPIEWPAHVTLEMDLEGKEAVVYHGDDRMLLDALVNCQKYDLVLTGHTHQPRNEKIGKTLVVNPGSTAGVREGKITDKNSVAIYDTEKNEAEIVNI